MVETETIRVTVVVASDDSATTATTMSSTVVVMRANTTAVDMVTVSTAIVSETVSGELTLTRRSISDVNRVETVTVVMKRHDDYPTRLKPERDVTVMDTNHTVKHRFT